MIAHFNFCPIWGGKRIPKAFLNKTKNCFAKGIDMIRKYGTVEV